MLNKINKKGVLLASLLLLFSIASAFLETRVSELREEKTAKSRNLASLLRMDLLPGKGMTLPPVERNIFSPSEFKQSLSALLSNPEARSSAREGILSDSEKGAETGTSSWPGYNLSLRYIGYVHSPKRTVGLVIVNGLALAVEEGEFLDAQVQVSQITAEEIVLVGPTGEQRRVSLEGEKNEKN